MLTLVFEPFFSYLEHFGTRHRDLRVKLYFKNLTLFIFDPKKSISEHFFETNFDFLLKSIIFDLNFDLSDLNLTIQTRCDAGFSIYIKFHKGSFFLS